MAKRKKAQPWERGFAAIRVHPRLPGFRPYPPPVTDAELDDAESQLGHRLPESYRQFMKRFGPGQAHGCVRILPLSGEMATGYECTLVTHTLARRNDFATEWKSFHRSRWRTTLTYFGYDLEGESYGWDPSDRTRSRRHEYRVYHFGDRAASPRPVVMAETFWGFLEGKAAEVDAWEDADNTPAESREANTISRYPVGLKKDPKRKDVKHWLAFNNSTVRDLALSIRDAGRTDAFPILADALQEAGCTNADLLDSCRLGDPAIDGQWVLQVLLGKS